MVLAAGESWTFQPPRDYTVAWVFVYRGQAAVQGEAVSDELVLLEPGEGAVMIETIGSARLLLGSSILHNHPLVLGSHSVQTSREALVSGVAELEAVGKQLRAVDRI